MVFAELLGNFRRRAGVTQQDLADALGVSLNTIVSWENGRRKPGDRQGRDSRQLVIESGHFLSVSHPELTEMLGSLGLAPTPHPRLGPLFDRRRPIEALFAEANLCNWPVLANNEDFEVVAWNAAANDLSELDFADLDGPRERHLLRMALSDHYAKRLQNRETVLARMVSIWKGNGNDIFATGESQPYFEQLIGDLMRLHPNDAFWLFDLFQKTEVWSEGRRIEFAAEWLAEDGTRLDFNASLGSWDEFDGVSAFDWHPANAATWTWLDARREEREARPGPLTFAEHRPRRNARELLRRARETHGFARPRLAEKSGLSIANITAAENGKSPLSSAYILRVAEALQLEHLLRNQILEAAGFDPEASDLPDYMQGYALHPGSRYAAGESRRLEWTPEEIQAHINQHSWPEVIVSGRCEVIGRNEPALTVFGRELLQTRSGPAANLIAIVTDIEFRQRVQNWEHVVARIIPDSLEPYLHPPAGHPRGSTKYRAYFNEVLAFVRQREIDAGRSPHVIRVLMDAWKSDWATEKVCSRVTFPLAWDSGTGVLRFDVVIGAWDGMIHPYWLIEFHPADAATFEHMPKLVRP